MPSFTKTDHKVHHSYFSIYSAENEESRYAPNESQSKEIFSIRKKASIMEYASGIAQNKSFTLQNLIRYYTN